MKTAIEKEKLESVQKLIRTCPHCEHTGKDVIVTLEHVGGQGYVPRTHCMDEVTCWARWDKANGFDNTPAIQEISARKIDKKGR